ncbi:MAG: CHASE2 domain-containing protein [Thermodesulfobacteriota bacterium]
MGFINKLNPFLKASPFKIGCLVTLLAALLFYSFGSRKPLLLASMDNRIIDVMFRLRGSTPTSGRVVIVDIDDKSLAEIGQWPWPRDIMADLVSRIRKAGAEVIGLDILFAEEDRTSPKNYLHELNSFLADPLPASRLQNLKKKSALDHDLILGEILARSPSVLGYAMLNDPSGKLTPARPFPSCNIRLDFLQAGFSELNFIEAYNAILNIPEISRARSEGFINVYPGPTGIIRQVPLFMSLDQIPYPSLALEIFRIARQERGITVHISRSGKWNRKDILGISVGEQFIPTDERGQLTINYRGPVKSFPYIPAADLLTDGEQENLKGKIVLIGTSAAGLFDLRSTPFSSIYPGVELQAVTIDNLLKGDPLIYDRYTEIGLTYAVIVAGGLLLSALLAYTSALAGGLGGILCLLATFAGSWYNFLQGRLVGITYPLFTIVAVFLLVTLANYFFEGRRKRLLHKAFTRYVSPELVSEIIKAPRKLSLSGEVKDLTVFFSDIRDFTRISEGMSSRDIGRLLNNYLTAMSSVLMEYGGTVDKYIGDAIMAFWGAPLSDQEHAVKAVRASLASLERLRELQPVWQKEGFPKIEIGIGLNSGEMNAGNFGSQQRFDYTVIGDNVNLASRLEGLNKVYGTFILISEYTRREIGDLFYCRFIDLVRVKGREKPVALYEPLCEGQPDPGLKQEAAAFEEALHLYYQKDFAGAEDLFAKLAAGNPCRLYHLYQERIASLKKEMPPPDWDGVFTHKTK